MQPNINIGLVSLVTRGSTAFIRTIAELVLLEESGQTIN